MINKNEKLKFKVPPCGKCVHWNGDKSCKAFPTEIPFEILSGDNDHSKPLKGQGNDLVFKKK